MPAHLPYVVKHIDHGFEYNDDYGSGYGYGYDCGCGYG